MSSSSRISSGVLDIALLSSWLMTQSVQQWHSVVPMGHTYKTIVNKGLNRDSSHLKSLEGLGTYMLTVQLHVRQLVRDGIVQSYLFTNATVTLKCL
jgi:hypothetical protein